MLIRPPSAGGQRNLIGHLRYLLSESWNISWNLTDTHARKMQATKGHRIISTQLFRKTIVLPETTPRLSGDDNMSLGIRHSLIFINSTRYLHNTKGNL